MGSDHRPVVLTQKLALPRREFCDVNADFHTGILNILEVDMMGVDLITQFQLIDVKLP
jgi:hypothetical protein